MCFACAGPQNRATTKTYLPAVAAVLLAVDFGCLHPHVNLVFLAFWYWFLDRSCLGFLVRLSPWSHPGCRCLRISFCSAVVIAHGSSLFSASHHFFHFFLPLHRGSAPCLLLSNGLFSPWLFSASLLCPFFVASYGRNVAMKSGTSVSLESLWRLPMFLAWTAISSPVRSFFAWNQLLLSSDLLLVDPYTALIYCDCTHIIGSASTASAMCRKRSFLQLRVFC